MQVNKISFQGRRLPESTILEVRKLLNKLGKGTKKVGSKDFGFSLKWDTGLNSLKGKFINEGALPGFEPRVKISTDEFALTLNSKTGELFDIENPENLPFAKLYKRVGKFVKYLNKNFSNRDVVEKSSFRVRTAGQKTIEELDAIKVNYKKPSFFTGFLNWIQDMFENTR
ncbi:MAG TPA: hypothetical protein PLG15_04170 [Candidatus Gastranaerophilaceae bacterium]|nr:hypothetical protein [Candidatus Gastranaerophilaceae bacterium]HPT41562.1 hypothetical protein [Candidatus Gastranaerophilaceae bacterium]